MNRQCRSDTQITKGMCCIASKTNFLYAQNIFIYIQISRKCQKKSSFFVCLDDALEYRKIFSNNLRLRYRTRIS